MLEVLKSSTIETSGRIERAATRIGAVIGGTNLQLALAVGRIVIEEVYDGDLSAWRQRGQKDSSLRQLAADPRLTISASALYRAIGIYELKVRLPHHPMWDMLTACHLRAVLGLPEGEQGRLLDLATQNGWTIQAIERAAAASRDSHKSSRGGRPRKPGLVRAVEFAERALMEDSEGGGAPASFQGLAGDERDDLIRRLRLLQERCDELAAVLQADDAGDALPSRALRTWSERSLRGQHGPRSVTEVADSYVGP
ncbi:hypothetical protein [Nannocystis sp. SCPEA4]|uniref:hypothetical protein n=1 Tax=Nannocystis sp. SCPEA4 TaxID=2996787 RepID=UPI0022700BE2|nr:hypothetical protein [Nannocystis sp. SCPEA4]MCY1059599.1 hypothetical protein [Nannocystis sp. SCPEA4]